ncbi:HmuY family protein [Spirosoma soli]|uniref:HmuY family protein n=1 Tax=Spirosoma soli TaxID=1770529 RepID=A0ABW5M232_9BACT
MRISQLTLALLLTTTFFACNSTDDNPTLPQPLTATTVKDLAADPPTSVDPQTGQAIGSTNKFTLFSFRENKQVPNTDSATNKWDIGFRGTTVIVNGGPIRSGQGGAYLHTGTFEELTTIPTSATFAQDQSPTQLAITTGSGKGWYNYNQTTNVVSPIPGKVLVVRTGEGRYAKMEVLSYYLNAPATPDPTSKQRYYTFRYVYQPDGSQKLN